MAEALIIRRLAVTKFPSPMKPAATDQRPYVMVSVQRPAQVPDVSPPAARNASSSTSSSSSALAALPGPLGLVRSGRVLSIAGPDLPVGPLRKRHREPLSPTDASTSALRGDPGKFTQAFRQNLRTASDLPAGALQGLVRNLVTERAGDRPLPRDELHGLMNVLVEERGALAAESRCLALLGLVEGLGGTGISTALLEVLVDRVMCMAVGPKGEVVHDDLRVITAVLGLGEGRLDRLGKLVDLVMDTGVGLDHANLRAAIAGITYGLRDHSCRSECIDAELHGHMLARLLRSVAGRSMLHVEYALQALWEHMSEPGAMTPAMRKAVKDQVVACRDAAGPQLMAIADRVLPGFLRRACEPGGGKAKAESKSMAVSK